MVSRFDTLIDALARIDAPILLARAPGLSEPEIIQLLARRVPDLRLNLSDEVVMWFSWQNGFDPDRYGEINDACRLISPAGLGLTSLDYLLEIVELKADLNINWFDPPAFPIAGDESGGLYVLRYFTPESSGELWYLDRDESEFTPTPQRGVIDSTTPTFDEYVNALVVGIDAGRLVVGEWGQVCMAELDGSLIDYPWV